MRPEIRRAREMRQSMSDAEVILWSRLKRLRERGFHVRRQAPFKGYYLDFVCYARRVAVEVDGAQHAEERQAEHDAVRDRILMRHGFQVLRFSASAVRQDPVGVMDQILSALEAASDVHATRRPACSAPGRHSPTLTASRSVPPH